MPRKPRERSATGIYHIMLRGLDKREIFISNRDNEKFLEGVYRAMDSAKFKLLAYCLMKNHVHLLIEEGAEDIGASIKRITCSYVQWHNVKYARVGHLFQNRFRSEVVLSEGYLLRVLRYIHQNPVKANMCKHASHYEWSSYRNYIESYNGIKSNISTDIYNDYFETKEKFEAYMNEDNEDECLEYEEPLRYTDEELAIKIKFNYKLVDVSKLKIDENILNAIYIVYEETGASIRQLSRVLGISKSIIEKAIKNSKQLIEGV